MTEVLVFATGAKLKAIIIMSYCNLSMTNLDQNLSCTLRIVVKCILIKSRVMA